MGNPPPWGEFDKSNPWDRRDACLHVAVAAAATVATIAAIVKMVYTTYYIVIVIPRNDKISAGADKSAPSLYCYYMPQPTCNTRYASRDTGYD